MITDLAPPTEFVLPPAACAASSCGSEAPPRARPPIRKKSLRVCPSQNRDPRPFPGECEAEIVSIKRVLLMGVVFRISSAFRDPCTVPRGGSLYGGPLMPTRRNPGISPSFGLFGA
jgi:hypothetical protein